MALDPGTGGSGSGNICSASPFDMDAKIDNLISRVDRIEQVLSELLGVDITAIQLSDITQNGGTLTGLSLTGGALSQIVTNIGKSNVYMLSNDDNPFRGFNSGAIGYSPFSDVATGTTLDSFAGSASDVMYRYDMTPYNSGFYYECQMMVSPGLVSDPPPKCRMYIGLGSAYIFGTAAVSNNDDPDTNYICFSYSNPRGDTTWQFMRSDNPTGTGFHQWHQVIVDTGVPVISNHWYRFVIECRPGSNALNWTVTDLEFGASGSGVLAVPDVYKDSYGFAAPNGSTYAAGIGAYVSTAGFRTEYGLHHLFAQTLSIERNINA